LIPLARRKIALKEARQKRQLEREKLSRLEAEEGGIDTQAGTLLIQELEVGLAQIDEQTRTLVRTVIFISLLTGLWLIWDSVFPAFGILQDVHLWSYSSVVDGAATAIPITLADVVLSILITVITVISAKNLPGLLEITLLNRLPWIPVRVMRLFGSPATLSRPSELFWQLIPSDCSGQNCNGSSLHWAWGSASGCRKLSLILSAA
jgi:potassium efflux system protein